MTIKYHAKPSLSLDFANSKQIHPYTNMLRESVGTYCDERGVIKYANNNRSRFDHDPITGESLGLLLELARTNSVLNSNNFNAATWVPSHITLTPNAGMAPDGTNTATKIVSANSTSSKNLRGNLFYAPDATWAVSIFAKAIDPDYSFVNITLSDETTTISGARFDINTGAIVGYSAVIPEFPKRRAESIAYPNGWFRLILYLHKKAITSNKIRLSLYPFHRSNSSTMGDDVSGFLIWGAQMENIGTGDKVSMNITASSYIPTTDTEVIRQPDVYRSLSTSFSKWYNQNETTFVIEKRDSDSQEYILRGSPYFSTLDNTSHIGYRRGTPNALTDLVVRNSGSIVLDTLNTSTLSGTFIRNVIELKDNYFRIRHNNEERTGTDTFTLPRNLEMFELRASGTVTHVKNFTYYPRVYQGAMGNNLIKLS